jgi:putative spermidine/putrescine transport system permease protein
MIPRSRLFRGLLSIYGLLFMVFLAAPIVIIVMASFEDSTYAAFPPHAFSIRWYEAVLGSPTWLGAFRTSLIVASLAALVAAVLGFLAALALVRGRLPFKQAVYAILLAPMIVPGIVTGIAMYFQYASLVGVGSIPMIAAGHAVIALPIASIILSATLQGVDIRIEHAAASLGADRVTILRRITLPLVLPGLITAVLFAFLSSFDEFFIALFFSSPSVSTLPIQIWATLSYQVDPSIAVVSTLLISVTIVSLGLIAAIRLFFSRRVGGAFS